MPPTDQPPNRWAGDPLLNRRRTRPPCLRPIIRRHAVLHSRCLACALLYSAPSNSTFDRRGRMDLPLSFWVHPRLRPVHLQQALHQGNCPSLLAQYARDSVPSPRTAPGQPEGPVIDIGRDVQFSLISPPRGRLCSSTSSNLDFSVPDTHKPS